MDLKFWIYFEFCALLFEIQIRCMIKYNAIFEKKEDMVYISHLDLMTLFRRAVRRTSLPFVLTKGYTPRVKISIPRALKLGRESREEEMAFFLTEQKDAVEVLEQINRQLPEGVKLLGITAIDKKEEKT